MVEMTTGQGLTSVRPDSMGRLRGWAQSLGLLWVLIVLCAFAVYLSPSFVQTGNVLNVGRQVALFGIVSIGMTFVILTRGIDLSVGSIVGVVAVSTALMLSSGVPIPLAMIAALCIGAVFGAITGPASSTSECRPSS